jgi:hypothetical protein
MELDESELIEAPLSGPRRTLSSTPRNARSACSCKRLAQQILIGRFRRPTTLQQSGTDQVDQEPDAGGGKTGFDGTVKQDFK